MRLSMLLAGLILISSIAVAQQSTTPVSKHIAKVLTRGDGLTENSAYKVKSVHDEYQVLVALGLIPGTQSLVVKKKPYDVIEATDAHTGAKRDVWFDISPFYPEF